MFRDIINLFKFLNNQKKIKRVFFFENNFIEKHLFPYINKNRSNENTAIISLYTIKNEKLKKFEIFEFKYLKFLSILFLLLKVKYCYSSTPDLDNSAFKKSVHKKTKYIYIQHSPVSLTMAYNPTAFNKFDLVQSVNKFQSSEITEINKKNQLKIKKWESKYLFFLEHNLNKESLKNNNKENILIAPTWSTDFFQKKYHLEILKLIDQKKYNLFLRPHYMSIKKNEYNFSNMREKFIFYMDDLNLSFYDYLITDWSGIFIEFANIKLTKSILINTKKKIKNNDFVKFNTTPIEIYSRNILGIELNENNISKIPSILTSKELKNDNNQKEIRKFFNENFF